MERIEGLEKGDDNEKQAEIENTKIDESLAAKIREYIEADKVKKVSMVQDNSEAFIYPV